MQADQIAARLAAYMGPESLSLKQLEKISTHLDLLLKWNARMNLTAVRVPEHVVSRHIGESLFATRALFPDPGSRDSVADLGSGAGFPGLPMAIARPSLRVTLIEGHGKKAVFLKEAIRSTSTGNVRVVAERAEHFSASFDCVSFRAVERFEQTLSVAATLVRAGGRLALLVGASQVSVARDVLGGQWQGGGPIYFPGSTERVLWTAVRQTGAGSS